MPFLPCRSKPGTNVATGSLSRMRPCSTNRITAVVVATTLVSEARSKIVSIVIASGAGTTARWPYAFSNRTVVAASDQHDGAWRLPGRDRLLDHPIDAGKAGWTDWAWTVRG